MKKIKVGILTLSDGREYLHNEHKDMLLAYQNDIAKALEETGEFQVVQGRQAINTNTAAKEEAVRLQENGVEATIFNYAIWCYPQFTAVAQNLRPDRIFCSATCTLPNAAWLG